MKNLQILVSLKVSEYHKKIIKHFILANLFKICSIIQIHVKN